MAKETISGYATAAKKFKRPGVGEGELQHIKTLDSEDPLPLAETLSRNDSKQDVGIEQEISPLKTLGVRISMEALTKINTFAKDLSTSPAIVIEAAACMLEQEAFKNQLVDIVTDTKKLRRVQRGQRYAQSMAVDILPPP